MGFYGPTQTRYFGEPFSPACSDLERVEPPIGLPCGWCSEGIAKEDRGYMILKLDSGVSFYAPYHENCFLRSVFGSVNHQKRKCLCYGGTDNESDPMELSKREAANVAVSFWRGKPWN